MRFSLTMSLRALVVIGAMFVTNAQAQVAEPGAEISAETLDTSEKFGWGDLNPVHWGKDLEHDATKLGKGIAKAAKKGFNALKALANPCKACHEAVGAGIDAFVCGTSASAVTKQVTECLEKVSAEEPALAEDAPEFCVAIKTAVEIACKRAIKSNETLSSIRDSLISHTCHEAHLCW